MKYLVKLLDGSTTQLEHVGYSPDHFFIQHRGRGVLVHRQGLNDPWYEEFPSSVPSTRVEAALRNLLEHDMSLDPRDYDPLLDGYCAAEGPAKYEKHKQAWKEARDAVEALESRRVQHSDKDRFADMLFDYSNMKACMIDSEPRYVVQLQRTGHNALGEEMGLVTVDRYTELIHGDEPSTELHRKLRLDPRVFSYSDTLEKAQGYAQGVYDGLQIAAGMAGRNPATE